MPLPDKPKPMTDAQAKRIERLKANPLTARYMTAGNAAAIPTGERGLWSIRKLHCKSDIFMPRGTYTLLSRWTDSTLMHGQGETVMCDNPFELSKHLNAAMAARGNVLVTGLGLACVARMLQANDRVRSITVIEKSRDVIDLVWPHTPHDRIELIHADAFEFLASTDRHWDCAWHDIWTDTDIGEPHLDVEHIRLMTTCVDRVRRPLGAWNFPRRFQRLIDRARRERGGVNARRP